MPGTVLGMRTEPKRANSDLEMLTAKWRCRNKQALDNVEQEVPLKS